MATIICGLLIVSILMLAVCKVVKEKKSGVKCIGCPHSKNKDCRCSNK